VDEVRSALIVAIDDYADPGLRVLRAPARDARALAAVLRDPEIGAFEVQTLVNEPSYVVNRAVEDFFAERRPSDLLLVHFSCHGIKDEDGELHFATSNTVLGRLGATAVAAEFVSRRMGRSRSRRIVLLLDCCYAGAFERGLLARATSDMGIEQQFGGRGRAVITASNAMEYAFEAGELTETRPIGPSVFTSALVEGLETGEADQDQDGQVGLDELYDYVYDKVRETTPNQTPGKWTFGIEGELYIARRSRPVTTPVPLPPELEQAIESPLAGVRAGAVQELAAVLRGSHAGHALAARVALERLADDDSRAVVAAATAALGGQAPPRLALSATTIDFGELQQHGQGPERRVSIGNTGGGILDARATTSASWLRIRQVGDELVIAVNTDAPGAHEGTVTVASNGGLASIRVRARIQRVRGTAIANAPGPEPALGTPAPGRPEQRPDPAQAKATSAAAGATPVEEAAPALASQSPVQAVAAPDEPDAPVAAPNLATRLREESSSLSQHRHSGPPRPRINARKWMLVSALLAVAAVLVAVAALLGSRRPAPTRASSPPGFQVLSMTFVPNGQDSQSYEGFALGTVGCRSRRCIALLSSQDGGAKWTQLTALTRSVAHLAPCQDGRQCVQQVRFATALIGYAYDPSLVMTTDGGRTWKQIEGGATSLEAAGGTVVWVASKAACSRQRYQVDWAPIRTNPPKALQELQPQPPPMSTVCLPVLYRQLNRLVLVGYGNAAHGVRATAQIYQSADVGGGWTGVPDGCGKDGYASAVALANPYVLVLLCRQRPPEPAGAAGRVWVRISKYYGGPFGPAEPVPSRVGPLNSKTNYQLTAATGNQLLVAETGASGTKLLLTQNGGLSWSTRLSLPGKSEVILVGFEDPSTGRVAQGNIVWTTLNGGLKWTPSHFKYR
jgi:hypothetical protein